ncbi:phosphatidylinositol phosphatase PTPRQ-like isoform X2 [Oscarella lobularis]|uniref:phosphatidylinositol phosphatase PTPRQ-like isoform X2 n=1 Tax=Oscarella lobularis TaxID=121494 RepID=UPI003313FB1F
MTKQIGFIIKGRTGLRIVLVLLLWSTALKSSNVSTPATPPPTTMSLQRTTATPTLPAPTASPRNVSGAVITYNSSVSSVLLTWEPPPFSHVNGILIGYTIYYQRIDENETNPSVVYVNETKYILFVEPFEDYNITVAARTSAGEGPKGPSPPLKINSAKGLPDVPVNVTVMTNGSFALLVSWKPPMKPNGVIVGYRVLACHLESCHSSVTTDGTTTFVIFEDLRAFTLYQVFVFARTSAGEGLSSCSSTYTEQSAPSAPPQNVSVLVSNSTSLYVSWVPPPDSHLNGIIVYYTVVYATVMTNHSQLVPGEMLSLTLTGLNEFTRYNVSVSAFTVAIGPESSPITVTTDEDAPSQPPTNLTVTPIDPCFNYWENCGLSKLQVKWDPPPAEDRNGIIILYEIYYIGAEFDTELHTANVSGNISSMTLTDLEEYVIYDVRIRAFTEVGPSSFSLDQSVRTYAAAPASPTVLSIQNVSSNSNIDGLAGLKVTWSLSPRNVNGLFVGIDIEFYCSSNGYYNGFGPEGYAQMMCGCDYHNEMHFLKNETEFVITNLTSYSWYDVTVRAVSQVEPGGRRYYSDWNPNIVLTAEDRPTGAPRNFSVVGTIGRKELLITWTELLCTLINGLLEKYVIYYQRESGLAVPSDVQNVTASPSSTNYTLSNLESFGEYSVWMQAFTGAGGGPLTPIVRAKVCGCYLPGSVSENCDLTTGQCLCRDGAEGQNCDTCILSQKPFVNISECLGPEFPPQNITATVLSSTTILIEWSPLNNFNVSSYNIYYRADGESLRRRYDVDDVNAYNATLRGLSPYTYYTITMDAATGEDLSPEGPDPPLRVRTEEDVPKAPRLLSVSRYRDGWSPAYLIVRWATLSIGDRNGVITAYEINYVGDEFDTDPHSVNVSGSVTSLILSGLEEYVVYDVKVRAYTRVGSSPFSTILSARTHAARPASPVILSIQNVSSSSSIDGLAGLKVTWSNPSPRDVNGLFGGIRITFYCSSDGYYNSNLFSSYEEAHIQMMCDCDYHYEMNFLKNGTEFVITNLTSYSWYDVIVQAVSQDGSGGIRYSSDWTFDVVLTAEDKPTGVPRNLSVVGTVGRKELLISWIELLCTLINGVLEKYVIYYRRETGPAAPSDVQNVTASPRSTNYTLSKLKSFGEYSVWMQAFTGAGGGPLTPVVRARTTGVCECYLPGSVSENCNLTTGQCLCRDGAEGQNCDTCILSQFASIPECLVPEFPPQNITATVLSSTAVLVEWSSLNDFNVSGYNIYYRADGESLRRRYDVDDVDAFNATLTGLRPFTNYTITMDAATEEGLSPEGPDPPLRVRTEEDVPKAPRLLSVFRGCHGCRPARLVVQWATFSVADRNGVITAYEINYVGDDFDTDPHSVNVSGNVTSLTLSGLEEYVVYDVKV